MKLSKDQSKELSTSVLVHLYFEKWYMLEMRMMHDALESPLENEVLARFRGTKIYDNRPRSNSSKPSGNSM